MTNDKPAAVTCGHGAIKGRCTECNDLFVTPAADTACLNGDHPHSPEGVCDIRGHRPAADTAGEKYVKGAHPGYPGCGCPAPAQSNCDTPDKHKQRAKEIAFRHYDNAHSVSRDRLINDIALALSEAVAECEKNYDNLVQQGIKAIKDEQERSAKAVAEERERCAKVAESESCIKAHPLCAKGVVAKIRAGAVNTEIERFCQFCSASCLPHFYNCPRNFNPEAQP